LLETIYAAYDEIAQARRVFKVETVGDWYVLTILFCKRKGYMKANNSHLYFSLSSYVAVAGLPSPRKDHAVVMTRFARDCLYRFVELMKDLEVTLGPDTTDLGMRFGLHSGPVTAGVLRGDRARFQLFGDTVNTTSRIETTVSGE